MDKILIVDDSATDRELLREILTNAAHPYQILEVSSGATALAEIEKIFPDLILLDIQMEDIDGFDFLKGLKKKKHDFIPVLLVSSFTGENDRLRGIELGATDFISKPLIGEEVQARVEAHVKLKKMYEKNRWIAEKTHEGIKTLYKELEQKNKELQRVDQLKSDFISTVSHEIRTPLGISTHGLSLVLDGVAGPIEERTKKVLITAQDNLSRLNNIIDDLLDVSKIEEGKVELKCEFVNVNRLLQDIYSDYSALASSKDIEFVINIPKESVYAYIDKEKIIQVLNNLLSNAIKFSKKSDGRIEINMNAREDDAIVSIKDNGIGIAEKDFDKLFGKFQQFSRTEGPGVKGTGLGLAISKSLVELHGGKIWASSRLKKGTTFYFTLSSYDGLRRRFEWELDDIIKGSKKSNKSGCLIIASMKLYVDKNYNDKETKILLLLNNLLSHHREIVVRPQDKVFLYDFSTIYIVLPDTPREGGIEIITKMRAVFKKMLTSFDGNNGQSKVSVGLSVFPDDALERKDLVKIVKKETLV